ncbi:MAG: hypothetical protein ACFFBD_07080 [Candidatus Hodarchaeota archaeon]
MTAQISDIFKFNGEEYDIVGLDGPDLFDPNKEGFEPQMASTACWRGFQLTFEANNGFIYLNEMSIRQEKSKVFNGIKPVKGEWRFTHKYVDMKHKLPFTGGILIGKNFIQSMYVYMGFQRPIAYRTVIELVIKDGGILEVIDHSSYYRKLRRKNSTKGATLQSSSDDDIKDFVEKSFSRRYEIDK